MSRPVRTIALAFSLQALFLLGCKELNTCLGGKRVNNNQPVAQASPTPAGAVLLPSCAPTPEPSGTPKGLGITKALASEFKGTGTQLKKDLGNVAPGLTEQARQAIDEISGTDERAVGQAASFDVIAKNGGLVLDKDLVDYVNQVANLVAHQGARKPAREGKPPRVKARRFFVGILDTPVINAYSLPGGYIYLTRGLLQNLTSESELAWVLGHEIAHTDLEHGLTAIKVQVASGEIAESLTGMKSSFQDPNFFGKIAGLLSDFAISRGFGREDELEADALGFEYATKAGYDPRGAERVLVLLSTMPRRGLTHARPEDRLATLCPKILAEDGGKLGIGRFESQHAIQRLTLADSGAIEP